MQPSLPSLPDPLANLQSYVVDSNNPIALKFWLERINREYRNRLTARKVLSCSNNPALIVAASADVDTVSTPVNLELARELNNSVYEFRRAWDRKILV